MGNIREIRRHLEKHATFWQSKEILEKIRKLREHYRTSGILEIVGEKWRKRENFWENWGTLGNIREITGD